MPELDSSEVPVKERNHHDKGVYTEDRTYEGCKMFGGPFEKGNNSVLHSLKNLEEREGDMAGRHNLQIVTGGLTYRDFQLDTPDANIDMKDLAAEAKACTEDNCWVGGEMRLDDQKWIHMRHDACQAEGVHHVYCPCDNDKETPRRRERRRRKGAG